MQGHGYSFRCLSGTLAVMNPHLAEKFELVDLPHGFYDNPYPTYRALRESSPVHRFADGGIFLSRYADVIAVYKDVRRFSSDKTREFSPKFGSGPLYQHHTTSLVFNDPPRHTRVRRLLIGALSPKAIDLMQPALVAWVDTLLDALAAREEVDLIEHFAAAMPNAAHCANGRSPSCQHSSLRLTRRAWTAATRQCWSSPLICAR